MKKTIYLVFIALASLSAYSQNITGTVLADGIPLKGVLVSDGEKIVKTDSKGKYRINSKKKSGTVFVITPSGYVAESKDKFQPDFWALLDSSITEKEVHNFNLISQPQDSFSIIFTADSHLTDDSVKKDFAHYQELVLPTANRIAQTRADKPIYSINLGDLSHDLYWYSNETPVEKVRDFITEKGFPALTYSVPGNHDHDPAIIGENVDPKAIRRWKTQFGPNTYSINIGDTHFIMLDDIIYRNRIGRGKKAKGVKGDRSYKGGLTKGQMKWIKKDLDFVADSANVVICTHIPLLIDNKQETLFNNPAQLDSLSLWLRRFKSATVFSGHSHRNIYVENPRWNNLRQFVITATSGIMWLTTNDYQTIGADGSTSGLWVADFKKGYGFDYNYYTYINDDKLFRTYNLSTVGRYYADNKDIRSFLDTYPERIDYSDKKFDGYIYVNFWGDRKGRRVEILEDGKPLTVKKVNWEDPLYVISYTLPQIEQDSTFRRKFIKKTNTHAYTAKPERQDSEIDVIIYDEDGKVLQSERMNRGKPFDKHAN